MSTRLKKCQRNRDGAIDLSGTQERTVIAAAVGLLVVGLAVVAWNLVEMPEKNLEKLKSLKVSFTQDPAKLDTSDTERKIADDQAMWQSERFPNTLALNYKGTQLTDRGMRYIGDMRRLLFLNVSGSNISDQGLSSLEKLPLVQLCVSATPIGDAALPSLAKIVTLRDLDLSDTQISPVAGAYLKPLVSLKHLDLSGTKVNDATLKDLIQIKSLRELDLTATAVTDDGLSLLAHLPELRGLHLGKLKLTQAGTGAIAGLHALDELDLRSATVTDADVKSIAAMKSLAILNLTNTKITDVALGYLERTPTLRKLEIDACSGLSDKGVARLKSKFDRLEVSHEPNWENEPPEQVLEKVFERGFAKHTEHVPKL